MKLDIKLCGFRSEKEISYLHHLPVEYAGFILAPSKRQVTINILCKLVGLLPPSITPVAVMVNPTEADVHTVIDTASVKHLQLHGDEEPAWCERLRENYPSQIHLIKALPAQGNHTVAQIARYGEAVDTFLVDTFQPDARGGTGKTFQWRDIPAYQQACRSVGRPLWIAGGLTPDNVGELIERYTPDGVDVASGIEYGGQKSKELMQQFVRRVRME